MKEETIEIPLVKATYEELQEVICELQVERIVKDKEIEQLKKEHKKTIDMAIHFINLHQDSKTLSLDYFDLKKLRGLLNNDKFYIAEFLV